MERSNRRRLALHEEDVCRTVAPPGYWDKAAQRVEQAYQAGELLYQWRLEDLGPQYRVKQFSAEVRRRPRLTATVGFLEGHWFAVRANRNTQDPLWQPRAHPELGYRDYLKALRLAEHHLQRVLSGTA